MWIIRGKGPERPHRLTRSVSPILCIMLALIAGCRESAPVTGPGSEIRLSLHMTTGDTFIFSRWDLDQYGYPVTGTDVQERWTVLQTGTTAHGDTGVTVVLDSTGRGILDTMYFRFTAAGDIYGWGFLSRIVSDMGAGLIPQRWDLLAHSGVVPGAVWVAGVSDSVGGDTVFGSFESQQDYFSGSVNGSSTVFSAYPIDFNSQRVLCTVWVSDSPSCFAGLREESTFAGNGFASYITSVTAARR